MAPEVSPPSLTPPQVALFKLCQEYSYRGPGKWSVHAGESPLHQLQPRLRFSWINKTISPLSRGPLHFPSYMQVF